MELLNGVAGVESEYSGAGPLLYTTTIGAREKWLQKKGDTGHGNMGELLIRGWRI